MRIYRPKLPHSPIYDSIMLIDTGLGYYEFKFGSMVGYSAPSAIYRSNDGIIVLCSEKDCELDNIEKDNYTITIPVDGQATNIGLIAVSGNTLNAIFAGELSSKTYENFVKSLGIRIGRLFSNNKDRQSNDIDSTQLETSKFTIKPVGGMSLGEYVYSASINASKLTVTLYAAGKEERMIIEYFKKLHELIRAKLQEHGVYILDETPSLRYTGMNIEKIRVSVVHTLHGNPIVVFGGKSDVYHVSTRAGDGVGIIYTENGRRYLLYSKVATLGFTDRSNVDSIIRQIAGLEIDTGYNPLFGAIIGVISSSTVTPYGVVLNPSNIINDGSLIFGGSGYYLGHFNVKPQTKLLPAIDPGHIIPVRMADISVSTTIVERKGDSLYNTLYVIKHHIILELSNHNFEFRPGLDFERAAMHYGATLLGRIIRSNIDPDKVDSFRILRGRDGVEGIEIIHRDGSRVSYVVRITEGERGEKLVNHTVTVGTITVDVFHTLKSTRSTVRFMSEVLRKAGYTRYISNIDTLLRRVGISVVLRAVGS